MVNEQKDTNGDIQADIVETYLSRPPAKNSGAISLLAVGLIFLFSLIYWGNSFDLADSLIIDRNDVFDSHQYWRVFTGMLIHADVNHFLSNALGLFFFGYLLYGYFGPVIYPWGVGVLGSVVNLISIATYPPGSRLLGASGMVYLMAAFWLTLFVTVERRFSIFQRLGRSIGFGLVMLLSSSFDPSVSCRTHYIGFIAGMVFGSIYFIASRKRIRAAEVIVYE
jgi:membrane associated rhomboid family serine protease